uniref:EGF-like domain-containing protein n=1 Tax=Steinernema glaseri TaxID=37863 RepID=A0A1I7ZTJ4_9BILA
MLLWPLLLAAAFFGPPPARAAGNCFCSNPCQDYSLHDCDSVAECVSDEPGYFHCQCPRGFYDVSPERLTKPGRKCKKIVDECALGTHECDTNADCVDTAEGYSCRCKSGYQDRSPDPLNAPGRSCRKAEPKEPIAVL